jgi:hypothetical protein
LFLSDKLTDNEPREVGELRGLGIEKVRGLKADYYHVLDTWLVKIQPHEMVADSSHPGDESSDHMGDAHRFQFIRTNDIRLNSMGDLNAGTKVTNFDVDQNSLVARPALASFLGSATDTTNMGYFDVNGNGIYDYEDDVYLNFPAGVSEGVVTVNNVRLSGPI